jgi:hypothetical protein
MSRSASRKKREKLARQGTGKHSPNNPRVEPFVASGSKSHRYSGQQTVRDIGFR